MAQRLREAGFRPRVDARSESVGKKIRDAELAKAPYMLVVGDREQGSDAASVRHHGEGDLGVMPVAELIERLRVEAGRG